MDSRSFEKRGLYICVILFLIGGAFGAYRARTLEADISSGMLEICRSGVPALQAVVLNLTVPCLTLFFASSVIGFVFIPALDLAGGFAAAYIMTAIFTSAGRTLYAAAYLAVPALAGTACQLLLSARCMLISALIGREKRGSALFGRRTILFAAPAVLAALTAAETLFYAFAR